MPEFKIKVSADTQEFGQKIQGVVGALNQTAGEQAGTQMGMGMERGLHGKFRGLMHVGHLFASVFGGMLGAQVENSILGSVRAGLFGAMGGAFIGGIPGGIGALPGAVAGGISGLLSNLLLKWQEQKKAVGELAEKFHVAAETIREMSRSMSNDQISRTLKNWNDLLQGIIDKKPAVLKALGAAGIGAEGALRLAPNALLQQTALNTAQEFFGKEGAKGDIDSKLYEIGRDRAQQFVQRVETLFGGLKQFKESLAEALKSGASGGQLGLYDYLSNKLRAHNVLVDEQTKRYVDLNAMLDKVKKTRFELLSPTEQLAEKEKDMADVQKELNSKGYMTEEYRLYLQNKQLELIRDIHSLTPKSGVFAKPDALSQQGIYVTSGAARFDRQFMLQESSNQKLDLLINAVKAVGDDVANRL